LTITTPFLSEDGESKRHVRGVIEAQTLVKSGNGLHVSLIQVEVRVVQVFKRPLGFVGFGNDGNSTLRCPAEKDLRRICLEITGQ
jgi:hypothetical protein